MRVAVIGAGPAGLSATRALQQRGHEVTVFEREAVVGGKCRSLEYRGRVYDLGANLVTDRYTTIRPLARELGLDFYRFPTLRMVDLATGKEPALARLGPLRRQLVRAVARYFLFQRSRTGVDDREGFAGAAPSLRLPLREWLEQAGLAGMREAFATYFVAYGYGVMDELPAAYALKFFDPVHFKSSIRISLGARTPDMDMVRGGYQAIWQRLAQRDGLDVRLSATVLEVRRDPTVRVRWSQDGESHQEHFDALFLACPLDAALEFLDASKQERRLFGQIEVYDYCVTAARLSGVPRDATFLYPYSSVFTPGQPTVFYAPHAGDGDDLFLFYAYGGSGVTDEYVRANIQRVIQGAPFNGRVEEFVHQRRWRYFPHVSARAMQAGWFDQVNALQGQQRTWYVGEVLSFPLVELVARFSNDLVARHFDDARSTPVTQRASAVTV